MAISELCKVPSLAVPSLHMWEEQPVWESVRLVVMLLMKLPSLSG